MAQADRSLPFGRAVRTAGHSARPGFSIHPRQFRGRHHAATIIVLVALAALAFQAFPSQRVTVFSDGGAVSVGATFDATREGLTGAEVALLPGDRVLEASDGGFSTVAVQRAVPVVVYADGVTIEVRGDNDTVAGVLALADIEVGPGDLVFLNGLSTSLRAPVTDQEGLPTLRIQVRRASPVTIVVDGARQEVISAAATVGDLVAELGLEVREVDLVTPPTDTPVTAGMTVRLAPAKSLTVAIDQVEGSLYTRAESVADVLELLGIQLSDKDAISHDLDAPVTNGMDLVVSLLRVLPEKTESPVPPRVQFRSDDTLEPGVVRYIDGTDGIIVESWSVTYNNGVETGREKVGSGVVKQEPSDATVLVGPPAEGAVGTLETSGFSSHVAESVTVYATWYDATHGGKEPGDKWWGITSTLIPLEKGICAVDPTFIPLGTRFFVPGYGMCLAADVGYAIKGAHIDLGFAEDHSPTPWRTGDVQIYILE